MNSPLVIAGLDPAIHAVGRHTLHFIMDARVEPAHDEVNCLWHSIGEETLLLKDLNRNLSFCGLSQRAEKQSLFGFREALNSRANALNLNRKVKP